MIHRSVKDVTPDYDPGAILQQRNSGDLPMPFLLESSLLPGFEIKHWRKIAAENIFRDNCLRRSARVSILYTLV